MGKMKDRYSIMTGAYEPNLSRFPIKKEKTKVLYCKKCKIKNDNMKLFNTKMYCDDCTKIIKKIYQERNKKL